MNIHMNAIDDSDLKGNATILDYHTAESYGVVPLAGSTPEIIHLAAFHDIDIQAYARLRFEVRREMQFFRVSEGEFSRLIEETWSHDEKRAQVQNTGDDSQFTAKVVSIDDVSAKESSTLFTVSRNEQDIPATRFMDELFSRAISTGASDIHLEPGEHELRVRLRIDGVLQPAMSISKQRQNELLSRVKILAQMDIAEKRRPQDGRILVKGKDKTVDVRVSSMPTPHGEKIVLRLLDKSRQSLDLKALGLIGENYRLFEEAIRKPNGMILVTGPTGSGKTTTLYAALKNILSPEINISTVEDPIEYQIDGINQTQMHAAIGYTFANAVRTFLRQDPDVIMVGEIRDAETAKYAIQAAQTGHLVFSTLHTNDAPSAIVRLLEMGMEPYLVASTVHLIMAQRLVRKVCENCSQSTSPNHEDALYLEVSGIKAENIQKGKGCNICNGTGYKGRIGVFELMPVTPEIQALVTDKASTQNIRDCAISQGMLSLKQAGIELVRAGKSTVEEVRTAVG